MCDELYGEYGDLPPKEGAKRAYRSTPYPESEMILFHNESSHLDKWPRKQWFYCELPSVKGGATPLVDCRQILEHIPPAFSERLAIEGLLYIRTFTDGLDVRWQDFFHTEDRQTAEQVCRAAGMDCLWLGDDDLQMTNLSPAVIEHPITQQRALFNQIQLHHPFFLAPDLREYLLSMVGEDRLPRNVRYGGGEPIEVENLRALSEAYDACAVRFSWAEGDVVLLDNMLTAHARDPYEGQRKIVVAMGEMVPSRAYCAKFKTEAI
ncbi:Taurine catabolism dioxygenase TauD, TfdA family [Pollutimonas bauzanensis]|uniref:Taurine catabolism dioxygenase TauD, TfdA family n=2 Tax=Pollutimonas bauzanensis TaxID=658167 RepID=A0A1M5W1J7_9BURK|nr:Taurine catabolism dioxygenase TauD, TfdA family [Pollutimonas bauzanensis]